ncbi:hypothetical protein BJX70DRAFT_361971 [Aspergillus crustosus]
MCRPGEVRFRPTWARRRSVFSGCIARIPRQPPVSCVCLSVLAFRDRYNVLLEVSVLACYEPIMTIAKSCGVRLRLRGCCFETSKESVGERAEDRPWVGSSVGVLGTM